MNTKKVLFADDEPGMRWIFEKILLKEGFEVDLAVDGYMAIEMAERTFYHIVVIDSKMPGITGQEAIKEIERLSPKTKFIMLSGYPLDPATEERVARGEIALLKKPFDNNAVIGKLYELCETTRAVNS